ncbi:MAG: hypothetical protein LBI82_12130 [Dysgonamonadaceae bacterium]|jgi:hypothetical protein|nr:hypothetical protein [Dysgonamonadaceae bacterium]
MKKLFLFATVLMFTSGIFAQQLSVGGQLGWGTPQGKAFEFSAGEKGTNGGLTLDLDALYHFGQLNNKLGAGITYNTSLLFGINGGFDVGLYSLELYGVKGYYKFFCSSITPYVSLSAGLSRFSLPEITVNGNVVQEAKGTSSFGLRPEVGVQLGSFIISAAYFVPADYKIDGATYSAGVFQVSLGFRKTFDL